MEHPEVDFAGLARSLGVRGEGPITDAPELKAVLAAAVEDVRAGACVVVDVWTRNRSVQL
jgi:thiamine pyrophosphate-dependent acetolactate synthase large subunit-like protein